MKVIVWIPKSSDHLI